MLSRVFMILVSFAFGCAVSGIFFSLFSLSSPLEAKQSSELENRQEAKDRECRDVSRECNLSINLTQTIARKVEKQGVGKCKHVCYTALFSAVDDASPFPEQTDGIENCAVFFTDKEITIANWRVVTLDQLPCDDSQRSARSIKSLPHLWFPHAESVWWIDAKIELKNSPWKFWKTLSPNQKKNKDMITLSHFSRKTIKDEMEAVRGYGMESSAVLGRWKEYLSRHPHHEAPLPDTCILLRKINAKTIAFNELWWSFIKRYSRRDQLSFSRALALVQDLEERTLFLPFYKTRSKFGVSRAHKHERGRVMCNPKKS